jgi:hypothetical protein
MKNDWTGGSQRFRFFAALCLSFADRLPAHRAHWLAQAASWYRAADQIDQDIAKIQDTLVVLEEVDDLLGRRGQRR